MPVTVTAKRALRSSKRKQIVNKRRSARMDVALRKAKNNPTKETVKEATSLVDRAAKEKIIHKNKAARIKSRLSQLTKKKSK